MRRIAILLLSILIVFSVTACTAQNIQAKDIDFAFHCKANINYNSEQISCDLSHTAPGMASIQLLSGDLNIKLLLERRRFYRLLQWTLCKK